MVVAAAPGDAHGDALIEALQATNIGVVRLTADLFRSMRVSWTGDQSLSLVERETNWIVNRETTVWWRRPGSALTPELTDLESCLVADEIAVLLPGLLEAVGVRWVDAPWLLQRARLKPVQLMTATGLGVAIPATVVTGDAEVATSFSKGGPIVAKAASTGVGIAPSVDVVPASELFRVAVCPTLMQRLIVADADARIVTIGSSALTWIRRRQTGDPPDWRTVDPGGAGFAPVETDPTAGDAVAVAQALGLSFSVQDWLLESTGAVFLEVNPQGQWLFLRRAVDLVVPQLAEHLAAA